MSAIFPFLPTVRDRVRALTPWCIAATAFLTVPSSLAARTLWSTPIGDFLVDRRPFRERPPAADEAAYPGPAYAAFAGPPGGTFTGLVRRGYLASGPTRSLDWRSSSRSGTTLDGFPEPLPGPEAVKGALDPVAPEALDAAPAVWSSVPEDTLNSPVDLARGVEATPAPRVEDGSETPSVGVDERFLNWVTRRTGNTKVEIPFELPAGARPDNLSTSGSPVRARYREQP